MFKNPLKYQRGGTAASQEQLVKLFQAAAENAQVDPEQLVQKASEIGQDEEAVSQFMQGLQLCAQGDPEGIKFIKSLFQQPAYKRGGKILDFVCKHAKGGYVSGCGCGRNVKKAQDGTQFKAPTNYYNEKGWQISENNALRRNNRTFYTEEPTAEGNLAWTNNQMSNQLMWPGIIQDVQYNQPVGHYVDEYGNMHDFAIEGDDLTRYNNRKAQWKENGGKVEKAQWGGTTTGNERTNANARGQYWEDLTINPEFGRTYRLTIPGGMIDSKYISHRSPNGTNIIKSASILSSDPSIRWSNVFVPGMKDYSWKKFYFNHMKKNVPQRLSNAQRLVPPMYEVKK